MVPYVTINLDKPRRLRFGMGTMVEFEQLTGIKLTEIGDEISITTCAKLLWVMLRKDDPSLTLEQVCDLVDDYGDIQEVMAKVKEAALAAVPKPKNAPKPKA